MKVNIHTLTALALAAALFAGAGCFNGPLGSPNDEVELQIADRILVPPADAKARQIRKAAGAFLDSLSPSQRDAAIYAFDDNVQRGRWSDFPVSAADRGGVMRGDLSPQQRAALDALLAAVLSKAGMRNLKLQMAADNVLEDGAAAADFGGDHYYVAFVGEPSLDAPWMLQFGGHHLALNTTFVGPRASFSPMLTGGQPMAVHYRGETVVIARDEAKAAMDLLKSLTEVQKSAAIQGEEPVQLALGPGEYGTGIAPEGVRASTLSDAQQRLLLALIETRVGYFNRRDAMAKMHAVQESIDDTYFAWWGPRNTPGAAYFRVTGPEVVMEYAPQERDGDITQHSHSIYRDPSNDYGAAWIRAR